MNEAVKVSKQLALIAANLEEIHEVHSQRHLRIDNIHVCNTDNAAVSVRIALSQPGVVAQQSTALVWDLDIAGNDFMEFGEGLLIPPLWGVWCQAGADNALVVTLSGKES